MRFGPLVLVLGIAAAVHSLEEWRGYEKFAQAYHTRLNVRLNNRRVFGVALIFLSIAVLVLGVLECAEGPGRTTMFSRIVVFALLVNALGHCAQSVRRRQLVPGTVSALFLIIPLASIALYSLRRDYGESEATLIVSFLASLAILPIAVYGSLWGAFVANSLLAAITGRRSAAR